MSVTDADIQRALKTAARIIDRYGDVYWPLFERLERELAVRRSRASRLQAYLDRTDKQAARPRLLETDERFSEAHRA